MSLLTNVTSWFTSMGVFHPTYKMTKVAVGTYKIEWGSNLTGTNVVNLTIKDNKFDINGNLDVIGKDSVFPFNVIAQMVNGALQSMLPKAPKKLELGHEIPDATKMAIQNILKAKVGESVEVPGTVE